jgi:hypothetical protein
MSTKSGQDRVSRAMSKATLMNKEPANVLKQNKMPLECEHVARHFSDLKWTLSFFTDVVNHVVSTKRDGHG